MDATFRIRRSLQNQGLGYLVTFLAWATLNLFLSWNAPNVRNGPAFVGLMMSIPLSMAWLVLISWRGSLTIRGDRVILRGVVGSKEVDLAGVVEARWRTRTTGGSLVLRGDPARVSIHFAS